MTDTVEIADAPEWLDAAGREIWQLTAPELRRAGLLLPSEEPALARYCDHVARWLKLRAKVNAIGETYETESKHCKLQRINPDLKAMLDIEGKIEGLEDRFALTPLMRFKLKEIRARSEGDGPRPVLSLPFEDDEAPENRAEAAAATAAPATPFGILN
ncbi:phage terminase small subunit P27 family [Rhodomicrobium lacus]|uniref:phage terminase small subunit P27 family n=1 Tax=Rhodomicrobium lacus TaxID=2498452 RepID=UPI000F8CB8D8|nr:phage terminase small subunit P27 family [Rhodomicrobium lacus]